MIFHNIKCSFDTFQFSGPIEESLVNSIETKYGGIDDFTGESLAWNLVMLRVKSVKF